MEQYFAFAGVLGFYFVWIWGGVYTVKFGEARSLRTVSKFAIYISTPFQPLPLFMTVRSVSELSSLATFEYILGKLIRLET